MSQYPGYCYVWAFRVSPEHQAEFERAYGPDGAWVALFRRAPGYLGTRLLRDRDTPGRYLTIDDWRDEASYRAFRAAHDAAYAALDAACAHLTQHETAIGSFNS